MTLLHNRGTSTSKASYYPAHNHSYPQTEPGPANSAPTVRHNEEKQAAGQQPSRTRLATRQPKTPQPLPAKAAARSNQNKPALSIPASPAAEPEPSPSLR